MAPKKKGGKKKKAKKPKEDWGEVAREKFAFVDVRNSAWASMRFCQVLSTSAKLDAVRDLIVQSHQVVGAQDLRLYLGETMSMDSEFMPEDYGQTLAALNIPGGSVNDRVHTIITYEHLPFSQSILNIPRGLGVEPIDPHTTNSEQIPLKWPAQKNPLTEMMPVGPLPDEKDKKKGGKKK